MSNLSYMEFHLANLMEAAYILRVWIHLFFGMKPVVGYLPYFSYSLGRFSS